MEVIPRAVVRGPWSVVRGPWSVVRGPWSAIRWPLAGRRAPGIPAGGSYPPGPIPEPRAAIPGPRSPGRDPRAAIPGPMAAAIAQGPPAIGSNAVATDPGAAPRRPRTHVRRTGARAMFLANIYLFFRIGFNCLIFAVKIAYITCYVPRGTRLECFT